MPERPTDETPLEPGAELLVYAGSMFPPAIEETIKEFEKRERVTGMCVYNGCGILVGQMKVKKPDLFFACDARFMGDVERNSTSRS